MEQYNFRLKEYRKIALKFYLAPWRELVIDKCGSASPRRSQAHAAKKTTRTTRKTEPKARRSGAVPAKPLRDRLPPFQPRKAFVVWLFHHIISLMNLLFRSAMVA